MATGGPGFQPPAAPYRSGLGRWRAGRTGSASGAAGDCAWMSTRRRWSPWMACRHALRQLPQADPALAALLPSRGLLRRLSAVHRRREIVRACVIVGSGRTRQQVAPCAPGSSRCARRPGKRAAGEASRRARSMIHLPWSPSPPASASPPAGRAPAALLRACPTAAPAAQPWPPAPRLICARQPSGRHRAQDRGGAGSGARAGPGSRAHPRTPGTRPRRPAREPARYGCRRSNRSACAGPRAQAGPGWPADPG